MSCPRTPTTTTSAATTTPNATPSKPYAASPGTLTVWATPSVSTPSKPHRSPNAASLTAIFDAGLGLDGRQHDVPDLERVRLLIVEDGDTAGSGEIFGGEPDPLQGDPCLLYTSPSPRDRQK